MLNLMICKYCDDALHNFIEELEDGSELHIIVCPTCNKLYLCSKQVAVKQHLDSIMSAS